MDPALVTCLGTDGTRGIGRVASVGDGCVGGGTVFGLGVRGVGLTNAVLIPRERRRGRG